MPQYLRLQEFVWLYHWVKYGLPAEGRGPRLFCVLKVYRGCSTGLGAVSPLGAGVPGSSMCQGYVGISLPSWVQSPYWAGPIWDGSSILAALLHLHSE